MNRERNDRPVFHAAQSALLSTPGHATYYQDRIEETRELAKINERLPREEQFRLQREGRWVGLGDYEDVRREAFEVLRLLPSPETVAVLGRYVEDPEELDHRDILGNRIQYSDALRQAPNCGKAAIALARLGIDHAPAKALYPGNGDLDWDLDRVTKWKDWWHEVKTGKRTYRFAGSGVEYGPDGPATPAQLEKIAKDRQRAQEPRKGRNGAGDSGGTAARHEASPNLPRIASILAGFAVLAALAWHFHFRKAAR